MLRRKATRIGVCALLVSGIYLTGQGLRGETDSLEYHVDVNAVGPYEGTLEHPFQTLLQARDKIRSDRMGMTCPQV